MSRVTPGIEGAVGSLPDQVRRGLRSSALTASITIRMAVTAGIVFLMTLKPDLQGSLIVIAVAALIGVAAGVAFAERKAGSLRP